MSPQALTLLRILAPPALAVVAFIVYGLLIDAEEAVAVPATFSLPLFYIVACDVARATVVGALVGLPLAYLFRRHAVIIALLTLVPILVAEHPWSDLFARKWLSIAIESFELSILLLVTAAIAERATRYFSSSDNRLERSR